MGYTHYFEQNRAATAEEWQEVAECARKLIEKSPVPLARGAGEGKPNVDDYVISLNGVLGEDCETFLLLRTGRGFQFCKTRAEPYDLIVCAILIAAHRHAPGVWSIRSDGTVEEWGEALEFFREVTGDPDAVVPFS